MNDYKAISTVSGLYNKWDLVEYFTSLNQYLSQSAATINEPIKFFLTVGKNGKKSLELDFHPQTKQWFANNVLITGDDIGKALADYVSDKFSLSRFLAMGVVELAAGGTKEQLQVKAILSDWKQDQVMQKLHSLTDEKLNTKDDYKVLWRDVATRLGKSSLIFNMQRSGRMHWYYRFKALAATNTLVFTLLVAGIITCFAFTIISPIGWHGLLFFFACFGIGALFFGNGFACGEEMDLQEAMAIRQTIKNKEEGKYIPDLSTSYELLAKQGFKLDSQKVSEKPATQKISLVRTKLENDITPVHKISLRR